MSAAIAERNQTKSWIMGLHLVSAEVANVLINQGVALSEIGGIDPSDIGIICSATIKPGGMIDYPKAGRGTDPMPQVQNPGMNVPDILQLKLSVSVTAAIYYEDIGHPIVPSIMNWSRIRQFRSYTTSCEKWEDPADLQEFNKDVSIIQLLEIVTEHLEAS